MQKSARKRVDAACSIAAVLLQLLLLLPHEMRRLRKARASRLVRMMMLLHTSKNIGVDSGAFETRFRYGCGMLGGGVRVTASHVTRSCFAFRGLVEKERSKRLRNSGHACVACVHACRRI